MSLFVLLAPIPPSRAVSSPSSRFSGANLDFKKRSRMLAGDLDTIILKALRKDPERRYSSAYEMAKDIERYLRSEPIQARKSSLHYWAKKAFRRNKLASALGGLSIVLFLIFLVVSGFQTWQVIQERNSAERARDKMEATVGVLVELFSASNPRRLPGGNELTIAQFLDRVQGSVLDNQSLDPEVQARLRQVLGQVQMARSRYQEAEGLLEQSLHQFASLNGEDDPSAAAVLHDLARLSKTADDPEIALPKLRECLARHQALSQDLPCLFRTLCEKSCH